MMTDHGAFPFPLPDHDDTVTLEAIPLGNYHGIL
jgi:hypothetical protein